MFDGFPPPRIRDPDPNGESWDLHNNRCGSETLPVAGELLPDKAADRVDIGPALAIGQKEQGHRHQDSVRIGTTTNTWQAGHRKPAAGRQGAVEDIGPGQAGEEKDGQQVCQAGPEAGQLGSVEAGDRGGWTQWEVNCALLQLIAKSCPEKKVKVLSQYR